MPELPEVETVRRDLEARILGARVEAVWWSGKPLRLARPPDAPALARAAEGRAVTALRRRAKYLLVDHDGGWTTVVHLGMSGRLTVAAAGTPRPPHTHVVWTLDGGARELRFTDPRRFGLVAAVARADEAALPELAVLGDDPLTPPLGAVRLRELLAGARRAVKPLLLDQTRVAGLGNIYVCEALHDARIHPAARADRLGPPRVAALAKAVVKVLERGIANRGTTLRDYVDASGAGGSNQHALRVYGREGEACPRKDGGRIRRITTQGRSTFFCPACQRR